MRTSFVILFVFLSGLQAMADVRLAKIFGSDMVLQRRKPIPVWGWADAGEKITVQLSGTNKIIQSHTIKAKKDGKWILRLNSLEAGGPYELTVKGKKNTISLNNVLIGEVWICSGQSNMEWPVRRTNNAEEEIKNANYPQIRHFAVPKDMSFSPKDDLTGGAWKVTTPENVPNFTAVGYYFARELYAKLNVPIGLINTSWGGTHVETWTSKEGMNRFEEFKDLVKKMPASLEDYNTIKQKELDELITEKHGGFANEKEAEKWSAENWDDSHWLTMDQPKAFDRELLPRFDGTIWFRRKFTLPASSDNQPFILSLGQIYDADITYVNGIKIGSSNQKGKNRQYVVPSGVLKAGENTVAVRIENKSGDGGIRGKAEQIYLTNTETEIPLDGPWKYHIEKSESTNKLASPNDAGTLLYNAMIAPVIPYAIQGAIWYQGESNAGRAYQYRKSFPLMIADWRNRWGEIFPFYFVQLASFNAGNGDSEKGSTWAELREAQALTLSALPNTGMAVTADIGEAKDIHPRNKQDVGKRLALNALKNTYGQDVVFSGPVFRSMETNGNKVTLTFDHTDGGLHSVGKYGYLTGFEVAGPDQKFHWAKADIQGNKVVIWSDSVPTPAAVRYGWSDDNIEANLFNGANLPAVPFRTDNWKSITEQSKFK